ncbi:hypothetical protein GEV33_007814 [Tenebrio molitor]|uniref:Uncharacterized protein n=1 Tax=Tenebrio molitor TaxID=7067 RepID=A0A8J6HII5_TENMO|nr:hypothetical protein GEV33_007814 [Tenebrio molitor]
MRQTRSLFMWRAEICWDKEIGRRIKNQQYGRGLRFAPQLFHKFAKGVEGRFSAIATKGLRFSTGNRAGITRFKSKVATNFSWPTPNLANLRRRSVLCHVYDCPRRSGDHRVYAESTTAPSLIVPALPGAAFANRRIFSAARLYRPPATPPRSWDLLKIKTWTGWREQPRGGIKG